MIKLNIFLFSVYYDKKKNYYKIKKKNWKIINNK